MRRAPVFVFVSLAALLAVATGAQAADKDVARRVALGGSCPGCEFSGRQLVGARFVGGDFARSALVGADLRGAVLAERRRMTIDRPSDIARHLKLDVVARLNEVPMAQLR